MMVVVVCARGVKRPEVSTKRLMSIFPYCRRSLSFRVAMVTVWALEVRDADPASNIWEKRGNYTTDHYCLLRQNPCNKWSYARHITTLLGRPPTEKLGIVEMAGNVRASGGRTEQKTSVGCLCQRRGQGGEKYVDKQANISDPHHRYNFPTCWTAALYGCLNARNTKTKLY